MKKLFLTVVAVFAFSFANAQEGGFKAGVNVGVPMGTFKNLYSVNAGVDLAYMWSIADKFKVGATTGYSMYSGKTFAGVKVSSAGFIPVAASAQYSFTENIFGGADLGYAVYAGSGSGNGGMYYQPKVGYQTDKFEVYLGYKAIAATGGSVASVGAGFNYKF